MSNVLTDLERSSPSTSEGSSPESSECSPPISPRSITPELFQTILVSPGGSLPLTPRSVGTHSRRRIKPLNIKIGTIKKTDSQVPVLKIPRRPNFSRSPRKPEIHASAFPNAFNNINSSPDTWQPYNPPKDKSPVDEAKLRSHSEPVYQHMLFDSPRTKDHPRQVTQNDIQDLSARLQHGIDLHKTVENERAGLLKRVWSHIKNTAIRIWSFCLIFFSKWKTR